MCVRGEDAQAHTEDEEVGGCAGEEGGDYYEDCLECVWRLVL